MPFWPKRQAFGPTPQLNSTYPFVGTVEIFEFEVFTTLIVFYLQGHTKINGFCKLDAYIGHSSIIALLEQEMDFTDSPRSMSIILSLPSLVPM